MVDEQGYWHPDIFPKQTEALEACAPGQQQNMVLLNGPRHSGKTVGAHHAVAQHAWNTDRGNICILSFTQSVGVDSGVWEHLTEIYLPKWIDEGNFGMEWVRKPYVQGVTKKPTCIVSNRFGNQTKISLESLRNEKEVEDRFKGKVYSMIWVNELSKWKTRKVFDTLKQCFRCEHLTKKQHLFLADTNPDLDFGTQSWIYQLWYEFRNADEEKLRELMEDVDPEILLPLQRSLKLIEFSVDDNHSMSTEDKAALMADFAHDQDLLAAYYYGKWVTASADAIFYKTFRPTVHVIGEVPTKQNPDPEIMVPEENCSELITGWDPGITNSAAVIAEKTFRIQNGRPSPVLKFLDELVIVGEPHSLDDFVLEFMRKMQYWERIINRPGNTIWRHWSDRSVLDMMSPESKRYFHQIIYEASAYYIETEVVAVTGPIVLSAAERGPGSVGQRVDLWKKLLFDERAFFSAAHCPALIQANKSLKKGTGISVIQKGSIHKHPFDAASYLAASECYDELNRQMVEALTKRTNRESTLVTTAK